MHTRPQRLGHYLLGAELASGGMATVYLARRTETRGPGTVVAIKRLHRHLARDPRLTITFADEARFAARIDHPNVVKTHEVVSAGDETFLVMDHVLGESLATLWAAQQSRGVPCPLPIARTIVIGVLRGLAAAHRATDEAGAPLELVHRDVSPQNILVSRGGSVHLVDFGVARATGRLQATTEEGKIKGKIAYMAPEQVMDLALTSAADIFGAGVVLWELVVGRRLYEVEDRAKVLFLVASGAVRSVREMRPDTPESLVAVLDQALAKIAADRFGSADLMADALAQTGEVAMPAEVARWVAELAGDTVEQRARLVAEIEAADPALAVAASARPPEPSVSFDVQTATLQLDTERSRSRKLIGVGIVAVALVAAFAVLRLRTTWPTASSPLAAPSVALASSSEQPLASALPAGFAAPMLAVPEVAASPAPASTPRPSPKPAIRPVITPSGSATAKLYDRY